MADRLTGSRTVARVWSDLDRPPLRGAALSRALVGAGSMWSEVRLVMATPSTNGDVAAAARAGAAAGLVVVAESQTAGRGRLDRSWQAPARSGLTFSVLLRPGVPRSRWAWLPLLAGLAVADAVRAVGLLDATVKWPNDVLVAHRKLAGVLAEVVDDAVVVGLGINVSLRADELPVPSATSLALAGSATTDRDTVLRATLRSLERRYGQWVEGASALGAEYRSASATIGRQVRVELPGARSLEGEAADVDGAGRLVVRAPDGTLTALSAGDVVHLRG